jgi:Zn ribbon nucleic-acid-binding protein
MPKAYSLSGHRRFVPIEWQNATLNTIPHHNIAVVECVACGLVREIERSIIPERLHHKPIQDIETRMACSACEAKQARLMFGYVGTS